LIKSLLTILTCRTTSENGLVLSTEAYGNLVARGATVIAFDISFLEPSSPKEDDAFGDAVKKSSQCCILQMPEKREDPLTLKGEVSSGDLNIVSLVPPIPPLAQSAVALAPFILQGYR